MKRIYLDNAYFLGPVRQALRQPGVADSLGRAPSDREGSGLGASISGGGKGLGFPPTLGLKAKDEVARHFRFFVSRFSLIDALKTCEREFSRRFDVRAFAAWIIELLRVYLPNVELLAVDPLYDRRKGNFMAGSDEIPDSLHLRTAMDHGLWFLAEDGFYERHGPAVRRYYRMLLNAAELNEELARRNLSVVYDVKQGVFRKSG